MEEEKKLYPLSFCISADEYHWGTEEFHISDLGYKDSLVKNGYLAANTLSEIVETYLDRLVGENIYNYYVRQFPVCIKMLKVHNKTPLKVSPNDEIAADRYDFFGKERLWYILDAKESAQIYLGFNNDYPANEFYQKCQDNTINELLNVYTPRKGEFYFIPANVPFAAKGEVEILEITESSPLDFTLCSWGQEFCGDDFDKSLNLEEALDFIDYKAFTPLSIKESISLPQFIVKILRLDTDLHSQTKEGEEGNFAIYTCVEGSAVLQIEVGGQKIDYKISKNSSILVPAEITSFNLLAIEKNTKLLEISVIAVNIDKYIQDNERS